MSLPTDHRTTSGTTGSHLLLFTSLSICLYCITAVTSSLTQLAFYHQCFQSVGPAVWPPLHFWLIMGGEWRSLYPNTPREPVISVQTQVVRKKCGFRNSSLHDTTQINVIITNLSDVAIFRFQPRHIRSGNPLHFFCALTSAEMPSGARFHLNSPSLLVVHATTTHPAST